MTGEPMAEMTAAFYKTLIAQKISRDVALKLTIAWMNTLIDSVVSKNKEKGADAIVDWLSKISTLKKD